MSPPLNRCVLAVDLKDDPQAIAAYVDHHRHVWPEVLRSPRAAGIDVYEREPLPQESPLWGLENIIVSPHVCGDVDGWETEVVAVFVDNLRRFVAGEQLRNLVDTHAGFGVG